MTDNALMWEELYECVMEHRSCSLDFIAKNEHILEAMKKVVDEFN